LNYFVQTRKLKYKKLNCIIQTKYLQNKRNLNEGNQNAMNLNFLEIFKFPIQTQSYRIWNTSFFEVNKLVTKLDPSWHDWSVQFYLCLNTMIIHIIITIYKFFSYYYCLVWNYYYHEIKIWKFWKRNKSLNENDTI